MWSVGVMVYQLILGKYPFDSAIGRDDLNKKILCCKYSFPEDHKLDRDCKNFIEDLLDPRPSSRLTPEQALNHPWLKQETPIWTIKKEVIQRLQSYRKSNDFLFICQRIIVSCFLQPQNQTFVREAFLAINTGDSGAINLDELKTSLPELTDYELDRIIHNVSQTNT